MLVWPVSYGLRPYKNSPLVHFYKRAHTVLEIEQQCRFLGSPVETDTYRRMQSSEGGTLKAGKYFTSVMYSFELLLLYRLNNFYFCMCIIQEEQSMDVAS